MRNTVILIYPAYAGPPLGPPLSLLSLAAPLLERGFRVAVLDSSVERDPSRALAREMPDVLCVGISFLTGPMIRGAIALSGLARRLRPDVPIVFGGWHSSLLPEQTLRSGMADIVVRNQGEIPLVEIASALRDGRTTGDIAGTSFLDGDTVVRNPDRPPENINDLPLPAFGLADFDAYEALTGIRKLPFASSLGCPYACHYCTDQVFYERRFNAYSADRVVSEVASLVARYRIAEVALLDSNFPVNVKRAVEIARGFLDSDVRFRWTFQASTDLLCRMTEDEVRLLGESGVTHMGFGTESASPSVLKEMNKQHQRVEDMYEVAQKALRAGIRVTFNLILGYPGETESDRARTFRVMSDISRGHPNVSFSPNVFTPYPGIPIWPQLRELGVEEPRSLEAWAEVGLGHNRLPWLQGPALHRLRRMLEYFLLDHRLNQASVEASGWARTWRSAVGAPARWRLKKSHFSIPWELWLSRATDRLVARRSLLTGAALSHSVREVC